MVAYAVYFDHKRQTDPDFRKSLKRNNRRLAKAVKEEAEAQGAQQREVIKQAVQKAKDEGFPADLEEKESYFMNQVAKGEGLCTDGMCCQCRVRVDTRSPRRRKMEDGRWKMDSRQLTI